MTTNKMNLTEIQRDARYWQRLLRLAGYYNYAIDGIRGVVQEGAELKWDAAVKKAIAQYGRFDERTEENIATLIPQAQEKAREWMNKALVLAESEGVGVKIICGTRSYKEQDALHKHAPRVTKAKGGQSWHNFGLAFDFGIFSVDFKKYYGEHKAYSLLGRLSNEIEGLEWGGNWRAFKDEPHLQLPWFKNISLARNSFERN